MICKKNDNLFTTASGRNLEVSAEDAPKTPPGKPEDPPPNVEMQDSTEASELSERRKALFEPLEPIKNINGRRPSAESLLPPPDFESANYPKGWLIGKKRKLVNVDEDSRCLEHLQVQLVDERSKRARLERENNMLQEQVNMLMNMIQETEQMEDEGQEVGDQGQEEP
ncbi:hypothetical protein TSUD_260300 [Trifolium subterraneum]|uniref:Uncharacterized protein n=1 Tax=Trifolium subterraneum TaxID=3900 RepID=A0A2Z6M1E8_TRISU|nr:hypothetical protein TSUD_260300 [Trifolium subterraneum]